MSLKLHCPGTADYSLLKNQCLENIRPFHLETGGKHQNWLFKIWHFLNLLFMLLATLIGLEMDIFCISPEQALNQQWNFEFVHSNTASRLLHEGGTRPGWKATPRGPAAIAACPRARETGRTIGAGLRLQPQYASSLSVTEIRGLLFFVTRLDHTCLVFSQAGGSSAQDSLVHFFITPYLVRILTIRLTILWKWRGY